MSKVMCTFSTKNSKDKKILLGRLVELVKATEVDRRHTLKVLVPIENDPFCSTNSLALPNLISVIKFTFPAGVPVSAYGDEVSLSIKKLIEDLDIECNVWVASERVFKTSEAESINYMYFMMRRDGFSGADYLDYYSNSHFNFGMETNGITYIQNYINKEASISLADRIDVSSTRFDSVSEMLFSSVEGFFRDNGVGELGARAADDEMKFVNREMSFMICLRDLAA